jgi:hypothetical protein
MSRKKTTNMEECFRPVFEIAMKGCMEGQFCKNTTSGRNPRKMGLWITPKSLDLQVGLETEDYRVKS